MTTHWAFQYIGKPWVSGARGPDTFDCWGLLRWVYRQHYHVELPAFPGLDVKRDMSAIARCRRVLLEEHSDWTRITDLVDGCGVEMSGSKVYHHVGIYLAVDGGLILHCAEKLGVLAQPFSALRGQGVTHFNFYVHNGARI